MLWGANGDALGSNGGKLHLIDRFAVPLVEHREAAMQNFPAFLLRPVGIPVVGDECQSEILGEPSGEVVLGDMVAIEIDAGEMGFSVFESCDDEVVVVGILVVALFVG